MIGVICGCSVLSIHFPPFDVNKRRQRVQSIGRGIGFDAAAQDNRLKFFGAAQVQVVYDDAVLPERRDEVFRTFVSLSRGVVDKMQLGVER